MNTRRLLKGSLALNLVLAGVVVWAARTRRGSGEAPDLTATLTNRQVRLQQVAVESPSRVLEIESPFHWSEVESTDYRVYMEKLRAIGCPEGTIRDIIVADVDQLYVARQRELLAPMHARFWMAMADLEGVEEEGKRFEEKWEALKDEREAVFAELLGDKDPYRADRTRTREAGDQAHWMRVLDFLAPEKREAVLAVRAGFEQARQELGPSGSRLTSEERETRRERERQLEAERDQQLAELLAPEELAEYQLRTSRGAEMRDQMRRVDFSEEELRVVARLANDRQTAEAGLTGNTPEARQQRDEIRQQSEATLRQALGESRYADYQRARDNRFEQICQVTERHGLPEEQAVAVYDMQREALQQARLLREDSTRTPEERSALLLAIRAETERSVREVLGAGAFGTYQKRGGQWIAGLSEPGK